eukprot:13698171-Alexandrium_andersonii.AAC.1
MDHWFASSSAMRRRENARAMRAPCGKTLEQVDTGAIVRRKFPLDTLGIGRVSLEDKVQSL